MKQDAYTLHKPMRHHFKRNRVIVGGIDQQWQMDLADMQSMQKFNDGYRYLLVCIDVFFPMHNKTTSYRGKLLQTIDLGGNLEVGLYSISYPNTWYTLQKGFDTCVYHADQTGLFLGATVAYGYYTSMEDLVKAVNVALLASGDVNDNIKLTYSALTGKVTVQIKNNFQFALFKPLFILLGFGGTEPVIKKTTESPYAAELTVVINHLRLLRHCRTADRRRHERPITQKYFCPRKVWRRYC